MKAIIAVFSSFAAGAAVGLARSDLSWALILLVVTAFGIGILFVEAVIDR